MRDRSFRIEVADRHGTVALLIDPPAMSAGQRARLRDLAGHAVKELAASLGTGEDHAREILLGELTRRHADRLAYERVAEQRGLLPL